MLLPLIFFRYAKYYWKHKCKPLLAKWVLKISIKVMNWIDFLKVWFKVYKQRFRDQNKLYTYWLYYPPKYARILPDLVIESLLSKIKAYEFCWQCKQFSVTQNQIKHRPAATRIYQHRVPPIHKDAFISPTFKMPRVSTSTNNKINRW